MVDFFIENIYPYAKGEERLNYKITKKGCEFIINKIEGQKGILFTGMYINKFHEMESTLKENNILSDLSPELQLLTSVELM